MSRVEHELMTVKETADYLRIPLPTVYYLLSQENLPGVQIGGRWRVKRSLVDRDILRVEVGIASRYAVVVEEGLEVEFDACVEGAIERLPDIVLVGEPNSLIHSMRDFHPDLRIVIVTSDYTTLREYPKYMTVIQAPFTREQVRGALNPTNRKGGEKA